MTASRSEATVRHTRGPWTVTAKRLVEAAPDFYDALVGDDPELPENLRPIAWARGLLNDYREMLGRYWHPDPLSAWEHLDRVRQMLDRLEAALAKAEGREVMGSDRDCLPQAR